MTSKSRSTYSSPILESVISVNEIVLGSAASTAMAAMYVSTAQAAGVSSQNTVSTQHLRNILGTAAIAAGTGNLLWSGLTQQVADMPLENRLKNWEHMLSISEGKDAPATAEDAGSDAPSKPADQTEGSATP